MRDWRSILARVPGLLVTAAVATLAASDVRLHSTDPAIARPTATVVAAPATEVVVHGDHVLEPQAREGLESLSNRIR